MPLNAQASSLHLLLDRLFYAFNCRAKQYDLVLFGGTWIPLLNVLATRVARNEVIQILRVFSLLGQFNYASDRMLAFAQAIEECAIVRFQVLFSKVACDRRYHAIGPPVKRAIYYPTVPIGDVNDLEISPSCGTISHMEKSYTKLKKLSEKNGDVEFQAEVPVELLEEYSLSALAELAEDFAIPGFRKGKVPPEKVREHIGEMSLLEDAANEALRDAMQQIAEDEKLDVIGRPQVVITKIAPKNPLEFKIRYALFPDISLPDYKKIGKTIFERKDSTEVTEKEVDEAVDRIQKMIASAMPTAPGEAPAKDAPTPPLTDATVKQFGKFATVADFRLELKKQLEQEKMLHMKDGRREETIKEIVKHAKLKVPQLLVDQELFEFLADRDEQLTTAGLSLDEYLKQVGKTAEQLEKDERALIEEDLRMSMVVQEVRKKENITADDRDVHILITQLKLRYPERKEEELHRTAEAMIIQNKLFAILEDAPAPDLKDTVEGTVVESEVVE